MKFTRRIYRNTMTSKSSFIRLLCSGKVCCGTMSSGVTFRPNDSSSKKTIKRDFESSRSARQELYQCWHVTCHQVSTHSFADGMSLHCASGYLTNYAIFQDKGCYVSTQALIDLMKVGNKMPKTLDNSGLSCEHGRLCPTAVSKSKRISMVCTCLLILLRMVRIA
jgi:hypothetical protein